MCFFNNIKRFLHDSHTTEKSVSEVLETFEASKCKLQNDFANLMLSIRIMPVSVNQNVKKVYFPRHYIIKSEVLFLV